MSETTKEQKLIVRSRIVPTRNFEDDLVAAVQDVSVGLDLFLDDCHAKAVAKMEPWAHKSVYHATGKMLFYFLQALFSFDPADIERAIEVIKASSKVCNEHRHPSSLTNNVVTKLVKRPNYDTYTEEEIHAEICIAECLLVRALLTFIQDEGLFSFIGGGLRLRICFQTYKECEYILEHRSWNNAKLKEHFESGVCLGLGMFNLIISSLPKRILKLLEFIGFSGDRTVAMKHLEVGHNLQNSFRGPLCTMLNLFYHTSVRYLLGKEVDNISYFDSLIPSLLEKHPRGTVILFLAARLKNIRGNVEDAMTILKSSVAQQVQWDKFRQISYWELCFCNIIIGQYRDAVDCMEILREGSNWSKAIYTYLKATILCMCDDLTIQERQEMIHLMEAVPSLKQKIVGKSLPAEKFVAIKSERFLAQNNWLFLPAFEVMYCFSYFLIIKGKIDILDNILFKVNRATEELNESIIKNSPYYTDNYCLALFLKGVCLSYMGFPLLAKEIFLEIYENEMSIKEDRYLISWTLLELGLICEQMGNYDQAINYLNKAKNETPFYTEFRIHQALQDILKKNGGIVTSHFFDRVI